MQANSGCPPGEGDSEQIESLCDNLSDRVDTARQEQALLGQLVMSTARTRPFRSRQYRAMLDRVQERYHKLYSLLIQYCR